MRSLFSSIMIACLTDLEKVGMLIIQPFELFINDLSLYCFAGNSTLK